MGATIWVAVLGGRGETIWMEVLGGFVKTIWFEVFWWGGVRLFGWKFGGKQGDTIWVAV